MVRSNRKLQIILDSVVFWRQEVYFLCVSLSTSVLSIEYMIASGGIFKLSNATEIILKVASCNIVASQLVAGAFWIKQSRIFV